MEYKRKSESIKHVELCLENNVDILWIGARTTVNPFVVQEIANALKGVDIPILVKNPINAELGLWLGAIERLYQVGIQKLAAIHRGFSTYIEMDYRNRPNWQIPIELKRLLPNLPLICDPSHIAGNRDLIEPISQMALDFGIKGLMIETHINPDQALSDSKQQITPQVLIELLDRQQHNISVLQLNRWESLLEDHIAKAQQTGLDGEFIKAVFELIHAQAVKKQL